MVTMGSTGGILFGIILIWILKGLKKERKKVIQKIQEEM